MIMQAGLKTLCATPKEIEISVFEEVGDPINTSYGRTCTSLGEAVAQVRELVKAISRSSQRRADYVHIYQNFNMPNNNKVPLDCPTRWNSTYTMLRGAIDKREVLDHMAHLLISTSTKNYSLEADEWLMLEDCSKILEVFLEVTNFISSSKVVNATMVLVVIKTVANHLNDVLDRFDRDGIFSVMNMQTKLTGEHIRDACVAMKNKFAKYESIIRRNECITTATLIDEHPDRIEVDDDVGRQQLTLAIAKTIKEAKANIQSKPKAKPEQELDAYFNEPLTQDDESPLKWWMVTGARAYPHLAMLAMEYHSVPATSTPAE
ncbi:uncharacterized protein LOC144704995 [Wolffia australiana]